MTATTKERGGVRLRTKRNRTSNRRPGILFLLVERSKLSMPIRTPFSPKVKEQLVRTTLKRGRTPDEESHHKGIDKKFENSRSKPTDPKLRSRATNGGLKQKAHIFIIKAKSTSPKRNHQSKGVKAGPQSDILSKSMPDFILNLKPRRKRETLESHRGGAKGGRQTSRGSSRGRRSNTLSVATDVFSTMTAHQWRSSLNKPRTATESFKLWELQWCLQRRASPANHHGNRSTKREQDSSNCDEESTRTTGELEGGGAGAATGAGLGGRTRAVTGVGTGRRGQSGHRRRGWAAGPERPPARARRAWSRGPTKVYSVLLVDVSVCSQPSSSLLASMEQQK